MELILRSKATIDAPISVGDHVKVFLKLGHEKRGRWLSPRPVLSYDHQARTVTVPGSKERTMSAAVEDVRPGIVENTFAKSVRESIDTLDENISGLLL